MKKQSNRHLFAPPKKPKKKIQRTKPTQQNTEDIRQIWEQPILKLIEPFEANLPSRAEKQYDSEKKINS